MSTSKWQWLLNIDKLIFKLAAVLIVTLVSIQLLHLNDNMRLYISKVDRLEGDDISIEGTYHAETPLQIKDSESASGYFKSLRASKVLNLRLIKPQASSDIFASINGKVIDDFRKGSVRLIVYDGDYVEIDSTTYQGPVQAVVNIIGDKVAAPVDGLLLEGNGMILTVGKVKFKN